MSPESGPADTEEQFTAQPHVEAHLVDTETGEEVSSPEPVVAQTGEQPAPPGTEDGSEPLEADLASLTSRIQSERDEYLDALRRLQADFENYKKRVAKQQTEQADRAAELLITKLLPVLDTVDLALQHVTEGEGGAGALQQVSASLTETLAKEGLERIDPIGQAFDPTEAEAVMHEPGEGGEGPVVSGVMRAGYRWKGRVVRPAMVKVTG